MSLAQPAIRGAARCAPRCGWPTGRRGRRARWAAAICSLFGAAPSLPAVTLTDRAAEAGIEFRHHASPTPYKYLLETMGGGVALLDFDRDGLLDILFVNSGAIRGHPQAPRVDRAGPQLHNRLYRNGGDGTFTDVTAGSGVSQAGTSIYGMGAATGDYNNDGFPDLLITGYGGVQLYRNERGMRFVDVTAASGLDVPGWSASAGFADLNGDGLLDLLVTRYLDWSFAGHISCGEDVVSYCSPVRFPATTSKLFANLDGSRFADVSNSSGLAALPGKALGVAFNDIEADGRIDAVIANDSEPQQLLCNRGGLAFGDCALDAGVAYNEDGGRFAGMGVDFEDYDNDGRPDIVITNLAKELYALFRNEDGRSFGYLTRRSRLARITYAMSGWGLRLADLDLDGRKDIFVAQGHVLDTIEQTEPGVPYRQPPLLALGKAGIFTDVSEGSGAVFSESLSGRGAAFGDLDNDGDVDVVMGVLDGRPRVLYNDAAGPHFHWIGLQLEGAESPRDGQGARVSIQTPDGHRQHRFATTAGSYLAASDRRLHFGLGQNDTVARIRIRWPSGREQELRDVRADQYVTVSEAEAADD